MVQCLNEVTLIGHLGKDPESRSMQNGDSVISFSLCTSKVWTDASGTRQERNEWHNVVIFEPHCAKLASRFLRKGSAVWLRGAMQTRKWQDKTGADRWATEVVLQKFEGQLRLIDKGQDDAARQSQSSDGKARASGDPPPDIDDDVPF